MAGFSAITAEAPTKEPPVVSPPATRILQQFILVSVIWLVYMAGHAGWSSSFRFADVGLVGRGAPHRRSESARVGSRVVRADGLVRRSGKALPVSGGEGVACPGGAVGAGASAALRCS